LATGIGAVLTLRWAGGAATVVPGKGAPQASQKRALISSVLVPQRVQNLGMMARLI
jgi:hypothetical protein